MSAMILAQDHSVWLGEILDSSWVYVYLRLCMITITRVRLVILKLHPPLYSHLLALLSSISMCT